MKRIVLWTLMLLAGGLAAAWLFPSARTALSTFPPAGAVIDALLPAQSGEAVETAAHGAKGKGKGGGAVPVTAATALRSNMPIILTAPGTVEPQATVGVKARVDGQITEVLFKEGDLVTKDQVLFKLDDRLILAQIKQVEANIARDRASLADAEATLQRREVLIQKRITSEAMLDTARAQVAALKATIAAGQAALEAQRTQLDYLTIRAPITGRTGSIAAVNPGTNIRASDTATLVLINQISPILVSFSLPQAELPALRRALTANARGEVTIPGPSRIVRTGQIAFIDNQVDKTTGTVAAKLVVPNADEALWPGQAVEVALEVEVKKDMIAVPASAVLPSQQGMIVWVIGADNKVAAKPVRLERIVAQSAFLAGGLNVGEKVVTDGQVRIGPGTTVIVRDPAARPKGGAGGGKGAGAASDAAEEKSPPT
jgi:multidrug efflux system membrane fusion protein